jgi:hypothetical protein
MNHMKKAVSMVFFLFLFKPTIAFAASSPCQSAARDVINATQLYRSYVHAVSMECTKESGACEAARSAVIGALQTVVDVQVTMLNTCIVEPPPPPPPPPDRKGLILNEIDYDQVGTDTAEFVEIFNASVAPISLDGIAVVFVNGADNTEYLRVNLSGSLSAGGYAVIATPAVVPNPGSLVFNFPLSADNIQNGSPDGIAIIDTYTGAVLDALSYEGSITTAIINGIGTVNLVEGIPTSVVDTNTTTGSLARLPNGMDTDDAQTDWIFTTTPTPGGGNTL